MPDADPSPGPARTPAPGLDTGSPASRRLLQAIGPGILFAAAAVGVSHLNQSTRAGAVFGLSLVGFVVLAHLLKLPAMLAGPRYAAATGTSLLQAYRRQGRHAIGLFGLLTLGTMFTIQAVVTIVTAAILKHVAIDPIPGGEATPLWAVAAGILTVGALILSRGGFRWLDAVMKGLMLVLAACTILAAVLELPSLDTSRLTLLPTIPSDPAARIALIAFVVALVGWMPAPLDISVWHSLWTLARRRQTAHEPTRRECDLDFTVGYALCVVLAIAFVILGTSRLFLPGIAPAAGSAPFAAQLIDLYAGAIGDWARPVISVAAVAVMLSTTLTVQDALPRTCVQLVRRLRSDETYAETAGEGDVCRTPAYWLMLAVIGGGAMVIITGVKGSGFQSLINLATTLSFLGTPVIAWFNHRAMSSAEVPAALRPGPGGRAFSLACVVAWTGFAGVYLWSLTAA
jgi:Mn2+/Fe2+ NRAMP family transporter